MFAMGEKLTFTTKMNEIFPTYTLPEGYVVETKVVQKMKIDEKFINEKGKYLYIAAFFDSDKNEFIGNGAALYIGEKALMTDGLLINGEHDFKKYKEIQHRF